MIPGTELLCHRECRTYHDERKTRGGNDKSLLSAQRRHAQAAYLTKYPRTPARYPCVGSDHQVRNGKLLSIVSRSRAVSSAFSRV
ncbi:hypothetical protein M408DRAFT_277072 [Serendipita vermifera MAFF 305830]|uniref:Uncharacterized protein n=1 Tax=Serendipita vermifera MAFF 305830 TaxID=933852 RepID=A0A0C2X021_SERVB|nr:hypothetical protein M408DRAFT_277072 [Serendipita vermifera MAFF 305830]